MTENFWMMPRNDSEGFSGDWMWESLALALHGVTTEHTENTEFYHDATKGFFRKLLSGWWA
ncbi:MAG: hypothetical protein MJ014_03450 [Methanocorpusculum sp.]|nr:hypothetical protein [Methanocorpusculum sp.]